MPARAPSTLLHTLPLPGSDFVRIIITKRHLELSVEFNFSSGRRGQEKRPEHLHPMNMDQEYIRATDHNLWKSGQRHGRRFRAGSHGDVESTGTGETRHAVLSSKPVDLIY